MEIVLVRHGQPDWSPGGRVSIDPVLTGLGRAQAEQLRTRRWGEIDQLWVSPMARAMETAEPLTEHLGMEPIVHDWMAEIGPAQEWDGSPVEELQHLFSRETRRTIEELWDGLPGAESFRDFHLRVVDGLQASLSALGATRIDERDAHLWHDVEGLRIVLVAHGGTNAVVIGHLLGLDPTPWEWERFDSAHTAVATLTTRPIAHAAAFGLIGFGDTTHLDMDQVTR